MTALTLFRCALLRHTRKLQPVITSHLNMQRISAVKQFYREFHILKQLSYVTRQSYCRRSVRSSYILQKLVDNNFVCAIKEKNPDSFCFKRSFTSMKDDEQIKTWLNEIKDDFDKAEKLQKGMMAKTPGDRSNADLNKETIDEMHGDVEDRLVKMEKLGYTTEEIIDLLKNTKEFDKNAEGLDSEEDDLESSDSDDDRTSDKMISENPGEMERSKLNSNDDIQTGINKMSNDDWSVVVLRNPAVETEKLENADKIQDKKKDWSVVEIEDFVNIAEAEVEDEPWQPPVELVRGRTGVFDIEELVKVVRAANARDVVTISIPGEFNFAEYMVVASAKSQRHMAAIAADVKWIYKRKKSKDDKPCKLEGEKTDWYAMDLGNIVLHIFMPDVREMYDLETLWTVGAKFDPKCTEEKDPYVFTVDELPWLKELEQASKNSDDSRREFDKMGKSKNKIKQGYHSSGK